jgi:hypothetical protein
MRKLRLAALPVCLLTAGIRSMALTLSYSPTIPAVPAEVEKLCTPTPLPRRDNGSANS